MTAINAPLPLVVLTAFRDSDAESLHQWRADPAVKTGALGYPFPTSLEAETAWMRSFDPKGIPEGLCLAVRERADGPLLGYTQLRGIDWISRCAEIGIVIGCAEQRGKGVGRAALAATMTYAFDTLALRRLWLRVASFNSPAIALYQQAGFSEEGRLVRHAFVAGAYHDVVLYGFEQAPP